MSSELCPVRPLFGGAISTAFPLRFQDVSNIRQVPDHQEVFVDPSRDESLIFELLDFKSEVGDNGSASWFLNDLAREQDAEGFKLIEQSAVLDAPGLSFRNIPALPQLLSVLIRELLCVCLCFVGTRVTRIFLLSLFGCFTMSNNQ